MSPSVALLVYTQVQPPSARTSSCMYGSKQTSEHANLAGFPNDRCSRARLRMRCVDALCRPMPGSSIGWASYKLDKQVNSDRSTIDRAARTCTSSFPFTRMSSYVSDLTLTSPSRTPAKEKTLVGKNNLAGVPGNRCNSSAHIRMECVIVPSWPLPGTSFQVNTTTLANSDFPLPSGGNCC